MDRREKAKGEGRGGGAAQVCRNAEKEKAAGAAARAFSSQLGLIARTRVFIGFAASGADSEPKL